MDKRTYRKGEIWQLPDNDGQTIVALISVDNPDAKFTTEWVEKKLLFGDLETMDACQAYQSSFNFQHANGKVEMYIRRRTYGDKGLAALKRLIPTFTKGEVLFAALCVNIDGRGLMRYFNNVEMEDLVDLIASPLTDQEKERLAETLYQQARDEALVAVDAKFPNRGGHA